MVSVCHVQSSGTDTIYLRREGVWEREKKRERRKTDSDGTQCTAKSPPFLLLFLFAIPQAEIKLAAGELGGNMGAWR